MATPDLQLMGATEHNTELRRRAAVYRRAHESQPAAATPDDPRALSIRLATPADDTAVHRIAGLDSSHPPAGDVLIGAIDGVPVAALGLQDGHLVADPFRHTVELAGLLRARREQLIATASARRDGRRRRRLRRGLARQSGM
jgi:hypothetical protein